MKKFMYLSIAAITIGMAACSSDDEFTQQPEERGFVKTEFNITIPGNMATRMSDDVVQNHGAGALPNFRGMNNIYLIPFAKAGTVSNGSVTNSEYVIASTDGRLGSRLELLQTNGSSPQIGTDYTVATSLTNRKNLSQVYKDVTVPVGTRSFLFYGVAPDESATAPVTSLEVNGKLNPDGLDGTTPAGIQFALEQIQSSFGATFKNDIVAYLNSIVNAGTWKTNGEELHELFNVFVTNHAGSSANVQALVQDLYTTLLNNSSANAIAIKTAIESTDYVTSTAGGVLTFITGKLGDVNNANFTLAFPGNLYLPDGAAYLSYDSSSNGGEFKYVDTGMDNVNQVAKLTDYVYPASLYYRANSTISVAKQSLIDTYENTGNTWDDVLTAYAGAEGGVNHGAVSMETKSLAVEDQIQYAVARLDLNVASRATLNDNDNVTFNPSTDDFTVTGLLIGGQRKVDYLFNPIISEGSPVTDVPVYTIWDNQVRSNVKLSTTSALANRVLVLETPSTEKVKFAIEFRNDSGKDFKGKDGIVPAGCKFYLIGEIDPANVGTGGITSTYVRKHNTVDVNGTSVAKDTTDPIDQVFVQDYVTIVNATVSSLQNAYNVIPDLRAPKLELGLSVNLTWEAANTYNVPLN